MTNSGEHAKRGSAALGALVALGMVMGGWIMGTEIKATRLSDRYVTVKGLVERDVKSDVAIWPLNYKEAGDDLSSVYAKTEADKKTLLDFLAQQGIKPSEIELGVVSVTDTEANEWGGTSRSLYRYIVEQSVTVRTSRVDQVATAAQKSMLLLQRGVVLTSGNTGRNEAPIYKFTGLNAIKPDMISEATRNARSAAERFAADSGSKVGFIRQANQGVFSIIAAGQGSEPNEQSAQEGYYPNSDTDSSVQKTVRVVTTVQYYLEK